MNVCIINSMIWQCLHCVNVSRWISSNVWIFLHRTEFLNVMKNIRTLFALYAEISISILFRSKRLFSSCKDHWVIKGLTCDTGLPLLWKWEIHIRQIITVSFHYKKVLSEVKNCDTQCWRSRTDGVVAYYSEIEGYHCL